MTRSPATIIPRSPCTASAGWRNNAGVPVELRVAAILRPISPLFPIPVTTTRPWQQCNISTARLKFSAIGPAMRSASARSASASMRTTFSPMFFMGTEGVSKTGTLKPFTAEFAVTHSRPIGALGGLSRLEMIVDHYPGCLFQSLALNQFVPGARLPIVFLSLLRHPGRQTHLQVAGDAFDVGFIKRTKFRKFLISDIGLAQL